MEFKKIRVARVSESIVDQLGQMILEGILKPGERLPPERELAQKLDVSRPSLREAIVAMESRGLLRARRGGRAYVSDIVAHTLTDPLVHLMRSHPETTFDVFELRRTLEGVAAYYAAHRSTEADRKILKRRFEALESIYEGPETDPIHEAEADTAFHLAIAEASHNVALAHVMRGLFKVLCLDIAKNLQWIRREQENHTIIRKQHAEIFNAIVEEDSAAARKAAHTHLAFVEATLRAYAMQERREERSQRRLGNLTE